MKKERSGRRTLLMSVLMSAPGPLVVGLGLLTGKSSTQLADFVRRSAELLAIIAAFVIYNVTNRDGVTQQKKEKLERTANIFVGIAMCLSGAAMLLIALLSNNTEKGNVIPGLIIAVLGVIANTLFWLKYKKLSKKEGNAILKVQSRLYGAKSLVDTCVTIALSAVALLPGSKPALFLDQAGSIVVALYLLWCGIKTLKEQ